mmetsp:Transcript_42583/g.96883  ORF Transcript_42583/g.96883 Transcript_42583/m.96883 type:complete len:145 (-) Transcript_42583:104-538(-)|eukprot:CAMPEP_0204320346 /NCGR_PEP_ID=MMETSP0469-20131031/7599_1 /ASSEMBLY_ACC=CAM_ASM_000384 /TAXON_ID=2969 /ORGANISM="Oxyrrhis marina" /LENGTH=144 /DNA_ID=CAMNT_0051301609 /DNA_START=48 /DNA_END=482 /DNA_ORIENTATION=+
MRVAVAAAMCFTSVIITGCGKSSGGSSSTCEIPSWPTTKQCTQDDLVAMGSCNSTTQEAQACFQGCGPTAPRACVQNCFEKECPQVSTSCLGCFSDLYSCAECAALTGKEVQTTCSDPYAKCVGIAGQLAATPAATEEVERMVV